MRTSSYLLYPLGTLFCLIAAGNANIIYCPSPAELQHANFKNGRWNGWIALQNLGIWSTKKASKQQIEQLKQSTSLSLISWIQNGTVAYPKQCYYTLQDQTFPEVFLGQTGGWCGDKITPSNTWFRYDQYQFQCQYTSSISCLFNHSNIIISENDICIIKKTVIA